MFSQGGAIGDDTGIGTIIPPPNAAPVVTVSGASLAYTENDLTTLIDSTATVTDSDFTNFDTGVLTVNYTTGGTADDRLAIRNQGTSAGQISTFGMTVSYGGTQIGTFTGGIGTTPLAITFNTSATETAVTALLQDLTYANVSEDPSGSPRTVQLVITDGDGGTSTPVTKTINVTPVDDTAYFVTNTLDSGVGSLRQAILDANADPGAETITFAGSTFTDAIPDTITLSAGELGISSDLTIQGTGANLLTLSGNNASRVFNISAGATVTLSALTITNGNSGRGGGIYNNGTLTVSNSTLSSNTAANGGGIWNEGSTLTLNNSTLIGNSTPSAGGGITINGGTVSLNNSTLIGNAAGNFGGGIDNNGSLTVSNSTFSGNSAGNVGGALWNYDMLDLSNSTFSGNTAVNGGGIWNVNTINTLQNNLFADSSLYNFDPDATNRVGTAAALGLDPVLRDNGGVTQTHALLPGSAAINTGTSINAPTTDQRGISRVGAVDIGAFESRGFTIAITSGTPQSAVKGIAFNNPLTVSVSSAFGEQVDGGVITYIAPGTGASTTATQTATIASGQASVSETANSNTGSYSVIASANGIATPVSFSLTNTNTIPVVTNLSKSGQEDTAIGFTSSDFSNQFTDANATDTLTKITITTLPSNGTLKLGGVNVGLNQEIDVTQISTLTYVTNPDTNGTDSFGWNGSDGTDYATSPAIVNLAIAPVNDAPILMGNATLTAVTQNSTNPSGSSITSLFSSLFSDPDTGGSLSGLAIVGNPANSTQGQWQYSINGTTWVAVGAAEGATALALSASTLVRFVPATDYYGTPPSLTVRALDNTYTSGFSDSTTRKTFNTTSNGGTTAIAATIVTLGTSITEILPNLLWRNSGSGENAVWQLNSFVLQSDYYLPTTDPSWQIASSSADFNNDGIADILWRNQASGENAIWQMNNTGFESGTFITPVADLNWQMVGTGDFDGDRKSDILWRNKASGKNAIWQMNGATLKSGDFIIPVADQSWQIAATADFDGDGKPDILWRNKASGENAIWQMNGATLKSGYFITSLVDLNWEIAGAADLGGDGTPDILWRNTQAVKVMIWDMSGVSFTRASYSQTYDLTDVIDPKWSVKPFVADLDAVQPVG